MSFIRTCFAARMARPLAIEYRGAVYHVMNRGQGRQRTFLTPTDFEIFLQVLDETHVLCGVEVLAYCLMGNHYHLCLGTPGANLWCVIRHLYLPFLMKSLENP